MKRKTWFAVRCRTCGETFFFSRPRRTFSWFPTPPGHGQAGPCAGHFRVLHYGERVKALRKAGLL